MPVQRRPAGYVARIVVPRDLRPVVGRREIVRNLKDREWPRGLRQAAEFEGHVAALFRRLRLGAHHTKARQHHKEHGSRTALQSQGRIHRQQGPCWLCAKHCSGTHLAPPDVAPHEFRFRAKYRRHALTREATRPFSSSHLTATLKK